MRAFLAGAFLAAVSPLDAASLRAAQTNMSAQTANASKSDDASQALDAVMSMVGSMQAQQEAEKPKPRAPSNGTHPKLDLGFTQYEQNLSRSLAIAVNAAVPSFDNSSKQAIITNVTSNVTAELHQKVKPLKQSIGKTWMVLPEDAQAVYSAQLHASFVNVFANSLSNIESHLKHVKARIDIDMNSKVDVPSHDELIQKIEGYYIGAIALDRCFGGEELMQLSLLELFDSTEVTVAEERNVTAGNHSSKLKKFCLNSLLTNLATRLNDAQSLLSMTMRFDAHASMDLVQTQKAGVKHH